MFGRSRLLFYADQPGSATVFRYSAYAAPQRMAKLGAVTADTSTTITAVTITQPGSTSYNKTRGPFGRMNARDLLRFYVNGVGAAPSTRLVSSITSNAAIVVDTAITLTNCTAWDWQRVSRGPGDQTDPAGSTLGWVTIAGWQKPTLIVSITTLPTEGVILSVEGRDLENQAPGYIRLENINLSNAPLVFSIEQAPSIRVGLKALTANGVDTGSMTISVVDAAVVR